MPTFITQGDVIEATYSWTLGNQRGLNAIHYRVVSTSTIVTELSEVATALQTAIGALALAIVPPPVEFAGVAMQRLFPGTPSFRWSGGTPVGPGTFAGTPAAKQIAAVITKMTEKGGRAYRGRVYVPFPSKAAEDTDATPTDAYLEAIQNLYDGLLSQLTIAAPSGTAVLKCILLHRESDTYDDVTSIRYNDKFGTQRRRGDYGRPN